MDYIQINPDNVAPSSPRPRTRKVAAYLFYRQFIGGGGNFEQTFWEDATPAWEMITTTWNY